MSSFNPSDAAKDLRDLAAQLIDDEEELTLTQTVADYLDSTVIANNPTDRSIYSEIAFAYLEGYEHATGTRPREATRALRAAGLSI